jgi:ectoine hydroxylase-related dioxygenase (phytanoyl-CoA dioxygenase family)
VNLQTLVTTNGYAVVENVIDEQSVQRLSDAIAALANGAHGMRNLRERCDEVRWFCEDERILALARAVIGPDAFVVRTLFFDKNEELNWKVPWHQDLTIAVKERVEATGFGPWSVKNAVVHVQPPVSILERMVTVRIHLDDCTVANGPLRVLPRSHRTGKLSAGQIEQWKQSAKEEACVVTRGGVVVMKPLILHASSQATEPKHRRVIHFEFAAAELPSGLQWAEL